ncbi:MAG: type II toxin-antitoxin system RelE/ParE family toxin [Chitinophagales bacterium]|nr:type II toxin-antitoxin system RelE/ParE family toxin [Chitinophagales bacterium]
MEKVRIEISEFAEAELKAEYLFYYEHYSSRYAERFRTDFYKQVAAILPHPEKFPECRFLSTKGKIYRNIIWGNYLIIFRIRAQAIQVLTLFHTKQHPSKIKQTRSR